MVRRQQQADRALRPAMRSPGRPMPARHVEREFWRLIAQGRRTEDAALEVGVSTPVASRWFRHAGGMPPLSLAEPTGRYLSFHEREDLALLKAKGLGVRAIARELERDPGTISRKLRRNAATRSGRIEYRATVAQWKAQTAARRSKPTKLASNPRLQEYVQTRLSGQLQRPDGTVAAGPPTTWKGLNKPHRADRRWATACSPQQISRRLSSTSPTMLTCGSATRRSTKRSTSKGAARSSVSWWPACGLGGRCASPASARATSRRVTSPPKS